MNILRALAIKLEILEILAKLAKLEKLRTLWILEVLAANVSYMILNQMIEVAKLLSLNASSYCFIVGVLVHVYNFT